MQSDPGSSPPLSGPLSPKAKRRDEAQWSSVRQRLPDALKREESQTTRGTPRRPLRLTLQGGSSHSPWFPGSQLFSGKLLLFSNCSSGCLPLPPPREAGVPEDQRGGQRSPPAWPGATRAVSCQQPSAGCCPSMGNPNKVTSPPKSTRPLRRGCVAPRTCLWLHEDFIQPFMDTVSI